MNATPNKTTADYAKEALALFDAMTHKEKQKCAREIGRGFNAEMKRVNATRKP